MRFVITQLILHGYIILPLCIDGHIFILFQSNGLDERFNQTLQNMLIKYVQKKQDQWDEYLDTCAFSYNTSVQESTHYSPFELMFGRKATLPIDLDMAKQTGDEKMRKQLQHGEELAVSEVEWLTNKRQEIIKEAKCNIKKAQEKQKEIYNRKHARSENFRVGNKVLKKDFRRKKRANAKLDVKYLGPYTITKVVGKGTYSLQLFGDPSQKIEKVNGAHLKPYSTPPSSPSSNQDVLLSEVEFTYFYAINFYKVLCVCRNQCLIMIQHAAGTTVSHLCLLLLSLQT